MILTTERLRLRPFEASDAPDVVALDNDPEVMRYLGGTGRTLESAIAWIGRVQAFPEGTGLWATEHEGRFIGWFHLYPADEVPEEMELGYRLTRESWGKGLGTEGSRALLDHAWFGLGVPSVSATTDVENIRSRRVMQKIGMSFAEDFLYDGQLPSVRYRIARPTSAPNHRLA